MWTGIGVAGDVWGDIGNVVDDITMCGHVLEEVDSELEVEKFLAG